MEFQTHIMAFDDNVHATSEAKKEIQNNIDQYGCHLVMVEPSSYLPGFVYSIGLYQKFKHPEIFCSGLDLNLAAALINDARARINNGEILVPGKLYEEFLYNYPVQFIVVNKNYYPHYFGYGCWFNNSDDFPAFQLVWPDKQHLFPWQNNFNPEWKFKQPLLDRNLDFQFYEERNLSVYTTKQFLAGEPILFVYHNENGDWQFHCTEDPQVEDGCVVCLEDILKTDPSINEVFHLDYGSHGWRDSKDDEWNW